MITRARVLPQSCACSGLIMEYATRLSQSQRRPLLGPQVDMKLKCLHKVHMGRVWLALILQAAVSYDLSIS